jgi:glycosyltransferase involved in cell wall biosynthesis
MEIKNLKIIHVVESFAGGVFDFIVDIVNGMPDDEHTIIYALREHTPEDFQSYFPKTTQFIEWQHATREIKPKADLLALWSLRNILKNMLEIDAIHLHSSKAGLLGRIVTKTLKIQRKVVYTPHGVSFLRQDVSSFKHKLFVFLEKIGAFCGGTVVGCSNSEAGAFHSYGLDAIYINNGIKCSNCEEQTKDQNEKICIGTIGRVTYQKNPKLFNDIAERFLDYEQVEFLWIGDGELQDVLKAKNIQRTGWLTRQEVDKKLAQIDIYLSTSLWEGLPLSVLQAMCASKPLVLSDCVGNKDLVKHNVNGKIFACADSLFESLEELISRKDKRVEMGHQSFLLVQKDYSMQLMIKKYRSLFMDQVLGEKV